MSKPSFVTYVSERLSGFTPSAEPGELPWAGSKEVETFPEFYSPALRQSPNAAAPRFARPGPIAYTGQRQVQADIEDLRAALAGVRVEEAFIPAISPSNVDGRQKNLYYKTDEEYLFAIAEAMRAWKADAGADEALSAARSLRRPPEPARSSGSGREGRPRTGW
jgi:5-methyltetrahydropteroyltriglutamate--homocysteine methyltransferase